MAASLAALQLSSLPKKASSPPSWSRSRWAVTRPASPSVASTRWDGTGTPYPLLDFSVHCFHAHRKLAPELLELSGVDNQFYQRDRLSLAFDDSDVARTTQHIEIQQQVPGFNVQWIDGDEALHLEPGISPGCLGAVFTQGSGAVEGYRHTLGHGPSC